MSAVMLGSIGPVKPFLDKCLSTHAHEASPNQPLTCKIALALRSMRRIGRTLA